LAIRCEYFPGVHAVSGGVACCRVLPSHGFIASGSTSSRPRGIGDLYKAYEEIVEGFTSSERRRLFHDTAASTYRVSMQQVAADGELR